MLYDSQELDCHPLGPFYKSTFFIKIVKIVPFLEIPVQQ